MPERRPPDTSFVGLLEDLAPEVAIGHELGSPTTVAMPLPGGVVEVVKV